jgi:hypothetical protein
MPRRQSAVERARALTSAACSRASPRFIPGSSSSSHHETRRALPAKGVLTVPDAHSDLSWAYLDL